MDRDTPIQNLGLDSLDIVELQMEFEKRYGGMCTFYGRDRGETGTEWKTHTNFVDFFAEVEGSWCEWYYIMRDGVWYVGNCHKTDVRFYKKLVPLTEALATVKEEA